MNKTLAKYICKEHGVKGFRKLKLKEEMYTAGKQCSYISPILAKSLLEELIETNFVITDYNTCMELANKGQLDTITIR